PDLTVYPPTPVENGKTAMLCLASNMFPDVVEFDWKNQEGQGDIQSVKDNDNEEVIPQMKIKDKTVISLLIVKQERINNNNVKYYCNVKHEQPTEKKPDQDKKPESSGSSKNECPPSNATSDTATYGKLSLYSLQFTGNFNMATLTYSLLILKSVAYCGIVSFLMYQMKSTAGMATRKGV
uniref:Ig-like domain-containing protein n=1 Tax=Lepisosteus oculatus TaxID=7918 RepID=W5N073_LEPOC